MGLDHSIYKMRFPDDGGLLQESLLQEQNLKLGNLQTEKQKQAQFLELGVQHHGMEPVCRAPDLQFDSWNQEKKKKRSA